MRDGRRISGRPIANDPTRLLIKTNEGNYVICKNQVRDADHAGNGAAVLGVTMAGGGAVVVVAGAGEGRYADALATELIGVALAATGVALGLAGYSQLESSQGATGLPASGAVLRRPCFPGYVPGYRPLPYPWPPPYLAEKRPRPAAAVPP